MQGQGAAEQELSGGEAASTSPGTAERHKPLWKSPSESNTATIVKGINQEPITKTASHLDVKKNTTPFVFKQAPGNTFPTILSRYTT